MRNLKQILNEGFFLRKYVDKFEEPFYPVQNTENGEFGVLCGDTFGSWDNRTYVAVCAFCDEIFGGVDVGGTRVSMSDMWEEYEDEYGALPRDNEKFGYIYIPGERERMPHLCSMDEWKIL